MKNMIVKGIISITTCIIIMVRKLRLLKTLIKNKILARDMTILKQNRILDISLTFSFKISSDEAAK